MIAPPASIGGDSGSGRRIHYPDMAGHELDACIEVWNRIKKKKKKTPLLKAKLVT